MSLVMDSQARIFRKADVKAPGSRGGHFHFTKHGKIEYGEPLKIRRVIRVRDTRHYEEGPDDRWYPIPGSGVERDCDRCGRTHEVHAEVELSDGSQAVVGTGCMTAEHADVGRALKNATSSAKTLARLKAEHARLTEKKSRWEAAEAEVEGMAVPPVVAEPDPERPEVVLVRVDDPAIDSAMWHRPKWYENRPEHEQQAALRERKESAIAKWKETQVKRLSGMKGPVFGLLDLEKRIGRTEERLRNL